MAKTPSEEEREMDNGNDEEGGEGEVGAKMVQNIKIKLVCGKDSGSRTASSSSHSFCQADECGVNLSMAKSYNRRHKVCERHAKAPVVLVSSIRQRFCQQCSKYLSYYTFCLIITESKIFMFTSFFLCEIVIYGEFFFVADEYWIGYYNVFHVSV